jgi:hypothetical protein
MFEQRVLSAYREKVARERQQRLLEEIEEEERRAEERNSKKSKEKERKKEKQRLLKQQKEEERLRKEEEKAAEEAARRQEEEKKAEEARRKKEEARLKKEAERKQLELERLKKEEERRKRQAEERERQAELERKKREREEAAKKRREEAQKKEREAKEKKEREERDRKEKTTVKPQGGARRQGTSTSPTRLAPSQPAVPKVPTPTPSRTSVTSTTTTPPHPAFVNGSSSSTPGTSIHTPSPRVSNVVQPQSHPNQPPLQPSHLLGSIPPPQSSGFMSPSLRNQFPQVPENLPTPIGANHLQQGRPSAGAPPMMNGLPFGIYSPLPAGNQGHFARFAPAPNSQGSFSPVAPPAMPHSYGRGFGEPGPPATPTYPSPIGSILSHSSPIIPPPAKAESGMSSPQISHSRKTSMDALTDMTANLTTRQYPPGINGSAPLPPPGLGRTIQRPAPIQRPQSTASSGRGSGFFQDEEMGVGSRALLGEGLEGEDEIIQPRSGAPPGFGPSRRPPAFPAVADKLWSPPTSSTSDSMWSQDKNTFLWGNLGPSLAADEHSFTSWDGRPQFPASSLQDRIKDVCNRVDPQGYVSIDAVTAQLQRNYPIDRASSDEVLRTAQSSPSSFHVTIKNGLWAIRPLNQAEQRGVVGPRMGPKPGTPPNDLGRNMLGSLAEVVRGFD